MLGFVRVAFALITHSLEGLIDLGSVIVAFRFLIEIFALGRFPLKHCFGVSVGVAVAVLVGVALGVTVAVLVGVAVGVGVAVLVGVALGVAVAVLVAVAVCVTVGVGVVVGVFVGVAVGVGAAPALKSCSAAALFPEENHAP